MKRFEVFDPAMCCSTGVCGPNVDPKLARFAADLHWLAGQRVAVERHNLAQEPQAFAASSVVKTALQERGTECLPLILLDGSIISQGRYPSREELARMAGIELTEAAEATRKGGFELPVINKSCC